MFNISCFKTANSSKVKKIDFFTSLPIVSKSGELSKMEHTVSVYWYNDYMFYEVSSYFIKSMDNEITSQDTIYKYFIFKQNEKTGFWYDSLKSDKISKIFSVDSFYLDNTALKGLKIYDKENDSLISKVQNKNYVLEEKYISKIKPDETYCDTTIFYYSKQLKNINYSFSKELDSLNKSKIFKVRLVYNKGKSNQYGIVMPQRELLFEFKEANVTNEKAIIDFVNRHERNRKVL